MKKPEFLNHAYLALKDNRPCEAIRLYEHAAAAFPELAHTYTFNIALARKRAQELLKENCSRERRKRAAIFAIYSSNGRIEDYVVHYLLHLSKVAENIVVVGDFSASAAETAKLTALATHMIFKRHGEYDFGSYKRGYAYMRSRGILEQVDELILCNDSCYGPLSGFSWMFHDMKNRGVDFWGQTQSNEYVEHIQSYFIVMTRKVFLSTFFQNFIRHIEAQSDVGEVIAKYELGLTRILSAQGFSWDSFINLPTPALHTRCNPTTFPISLAKSGAELIKVKSMKYPDCNAQGIKNTRDFIKMVNPYLLSMICRHQENN